jgi:hypothetical protein
MISEAIVRSSNIRDEVEMELWFAISGFHLLPALVASSV